MDFQTFLNLVPKIKNVSLPGEDAHCKMAPPERAELIKNIDWSQLKPRRAAVLMLVFPMDGRAHLALIQRNEYKGVHSSQIAFPGGKIELTDPTPLDTALRETGEEIGVMADSVEIVRQFSRVYIPPSNFEVTPFLGLVDKEPQFQPDPREVAEMVKVSLSDFLDDANVVINQMSTSYSESIAVPAFKLSDKIVWGATAMMLSELKEVLKTALLTDAIL
jgi:8-oxo-dGTP pyrophosphatase MutT (NUDIX family)